MLNSHASLGVTPSPPHPLRPQSTGRGRDNPEGRTECDHPEEALEAHQMSLKLEFYNWAGFLAGSDDRAQEDTMGRGQCRLGS